ncbi:hypothetical protein FF38_03791 [Lucilia cuprina]|uniref:DUF4780 domain-containing protein n=1 Tax=Lucilia cuprina TaxID=7375 RepID=A0A0L0C183_LUCCU|nr:hypothetical protein FF38_03791 [Lucilia cuprina]
MKDSKTTLGSATSAVISARRPFNEVVKDHLLMALVNDKDMECRLSLKFIPAEKIPMGPRARIWLSKITTETQKILECLKSQSPNIHMDDWSILRAEHEPYLGYYRVGLW